MQDLLTTFSSAQAVTASAPSSNVLDMLVPRDEGVGDMIEVNAYVTTAFTAAGAATLQVVLQGSVDNAAWNDIMMTAAIPVANLTLGQWLFAADLPRLFQQNEEVVGMPQYIRLNYLVATGPMTAGTITAWLAGGEDREAYATYPRNYAV